ncbi:HD domain-containing protein [Candidatus Methylocalor cossyra]|uniref:Phosphohydrolase n=1 Tax=Candidatus Methylocalor cossyra TaxID=3108543 RepID=A0ABM9NMR4_9GAMM
MYSHQPMRLIFRALAFAADKHRTQRRKDVDESAYINHPIALANVLANEAEIDDPIVICAALLHDTIEDTPTKQGELARHFGVAIAQIVVEVTDDKNLPKEERKRLQIEHAPFLSEAAKCVKLADKIFNLRDIASRPPADWNLQRRQAYFEWAKRVVDGLRGVNPALETLFDLAYQARPENE